MKKFMERRHLAGMVKKCGIGVSPGYMMKLSDYFDRITGFKGYLMQIALIKKRTRQQSDAATAWIYCSNGTLLPFSLIAAKFLNPLYPV